MAAAAVETATPPSKVQVQHALLWDRDEALAARVAGVLRADGHAVHALSHHDEVWACLAQDRPDLAVVGFWQPDDVATVRRVRSRFDGPLVCYSGRAGASERITVLELGADDVVPSPMSYQELALRVQAVVRRSDPGDRPHSGTLTCGPLTADRGTRQVRVGDAWVQLTAVEFALLAFLMTNPRVSFSRRDLLRQVWGYEIGDTSTVSVHIRRLRSKLERDPRRPELLRTVWGSGYYFDAGDD